MCSGGLYGCFCCRIRQSQCLVCSSRLFPTACQGTLVSSTCHGACEGRQGGREEGRGEKDELSLHLAFYSLE